MLNDIAATDGITKFNKLAEMTGISANTFTRIKNNDIRTVSIETFKKLNAAFGDRYNLRWFQGDSPYMTVKEAIEAKDKLPVSQIMPDSSAEIIASLNRELERQEKSFNCQLAAKMKLSPLRMNSLQIKTVSLQRANKSSKPSK